MRNNDNTLNPKGQKQNYLASSFARLEDKDIQNIKAIIADVVTLKITKEIGLSKVLRKYTQKNGSFYKKSLILETYQMLSKTNVLLLDHAQSQNLLTLLRTKKQRSSSGITPVTVLTKPYPCPGKCIFCPNDVRMPKSYLSDEPGAQRAAKNKFDPYLQTYNRLLAFKKMGHPTEKIELIILGGTWTSYPLPYQYWFIKRCFDALNDFSKTSINPKENDIAMPYDSSNMQEIHGEKIIKTYNQVVSNSIKNIQLKTKSESASLEELQNTQKNNEHAFARCVGLVVETRQDEISHNTVTHLRLLGTTKVQIGFQSLQDKVLKLNNRGHSVKITADAVGILRQAGFKIHAHWMPNLYGSDPQLDIKDYKRMFSSKLFKPDELKIYPCSLIQSAELMSYFKKGLWKPYTKKELIYVLTECYKITPDYCRITRMIRDISSDDIVVGNKVTNMRELIEKKLSKENVLIREIRYREIKTDKIDKSKLKLHRMSYITDVSREYFIQFVTKDYKIAGFLRLSIPTKPNFISELKGSTIIREIHIYGQSLEIGHKADSNAQHMGLGKALMQESFRISKKNGFKKISVISAVGTKEYYRKNGFEDGKLYQFKYL